ncbi:cytochrome P450 monooxygenase-like protein [Periconia macrospinosa]|uniref:Cytochrome P450 monooxygenase-like protein n=1 Tax=Periconia macrospinosa TaxID=97972 RepID=A0A2V1EAX0_9PLEO|nr:cytochrome P450 monooxygenase-like protein [Periconia macrospinosa]
MEPLQSSTILSPSAPTSLPFSSVTLVSILIASAIALVALSWNKSNIPHVNPVARFSPKTTEQLKFIKHGVEILNQAKKEFAGRAFRMINNTGEVIVLPTRFANIIRNEKNLSFALAIKRDFHAHVPGFQPFGVLDHEGEVLQNLTRKQLTKLLNTVTQPLASETTFAVHLIYGDSPDWMETNISDSLLELISRLSSRVFLGEELCRNEDWLKITKQYTVDGFVAAQEMTVVPESLRFLLSLFSRRCKAVRNGLHRAQEIIKPVIEKRRLLKEKARKEGVPVPMFNDSIEWAEAECKGISYDPAYLQLTLSFAAIHTTSDLLSKTMLLLANDPAQIEPLREEILRVLKKDGWSKTALYNLKLVDSTLKEAQRMMPTDRLSMRRLATKDVHLGEDITIRKGQTVMVDGTLNEDPTVYENPGKFDTYRWLRMRNTPEYANKAQFVTTSPEHLAFGHGMHACPGRFFAANEMKVALCHLLLKYDWELAPGTTTELFTFGTANVVNPKSMLRYRKRDVEIDLESLGFD